MNHLKYKKTAFTRHLWLCFAIFLVLFNSTPVKKYIRLHVMHQEVPLTTDAPIAFHSLLAKDCTLIERHTVSFEAFSAMNQSAHTGADDVLAIAILASVAALLFAVPVTRRLTHAAEHQLQPDNLPVYLHHCRLQV